MSHQAEHYNHKNKTSCIHRNRKPGNSFFVVNMASRARSPFDDDDRVLKQTTTTVATRTSPNKRFNEQNNSCVRLLYIPLPYSAQQGRGMTMFGVVRGTWTTTANFSSFHLELNAVIAYLARALLEPLGYWTDLENCEFRCSNINSFLTWYRPRRRLRPCLSSLMKTTATTTTLHNMLTILQLTDSCSLGLQRTFLILDIHVVGLIDTCQNNVSADRYHVTVSLAQV